MQRLRYDHIQRNPRIVSDGSKGVIIVWDDMRLVTHYDIYAQKVDSLGRVRWSLGGIQIVGAGGDQKFPQITEDGTGGAIIVWEDNRNGNWDIYAQRVDAGGNLLWTTDAVPVCTNTADQNDFRVIADGEGGAIVVWEDQRNRFSGTGVDLFAQKISSVGNLLWMSGGLEVSVDTLTQENPRLISDGAGGAIFVWQDLRNFAIGDSSFYDLYSRRIYASGDVAWSVPVNLFDMNQWKHVLVPDGNQGVIIFWEDARNLTEYNLYAQRIR